MFSNYVMAQPCDCERKSTYRWRFEPADLLQKAENASAIDSVTDTRVIGASTDSPKIGLNMASTLGTFICSPSLNPPCHKSAWSSLGGSTATVPCRLHTADVLNALLQRQHLVSTRYAG